MNNLSINEVWNRLLQYEGETFHTISRNLPFTFKFINENTIITSRTKYNLTKTNFAKALKLMPIECVSKISKDIRGASYVFSILSDRRINN